MPRYKIVVQATLGQMKDQGVRVASRCLWDTSVDNYASVTYTNVRAPDAAFSPPCSPSALSLCLPPPGPPRAIPGRVQEKDGKREGPRTLCSNPLTPPLRGGQLAAGDALVHHDGLRPLLRVSSAALGKGVRDLRYEFLGAERSCE